MRENIKAIFSPTAGKVTVSLLLAAFVHYYLVAEVLRAKAAEGLQQVSQFWFTNYLDALPYLETDNTFVKFLIFFAGSYLLVWLVTGFFAATENLETVAIKKLRRRA